MSLLEISELRVEIGAVRAVDGVSLTMDAGEIVGVVGESGSGKSTLLRAVAGVPVPRARTTRGKVTVDGRPVDARHPSPTVAMVFQDPMTALDPAMRVGDQIAEVPRRRDGLGRRAARAKALELMKEVGIPDASRRFGAYPHELSGGLRQRVLIAAALSADPQLLLCDEPTTALDVTVQAHIVRLLQRLRDERGLAILYVTHDLLLVGALCDRIEVVYAAEVVERGDCRPLLAAPRHPYTQRLLQAAPDIGSPADRLVAIPGQPPSLADPPAGCRFAPRCTFAAERCATATGLRAERGAWDTACVRADELLGSAA